MLLLLELDKLQIGLHVLLHRRGNRRDKFRPFLSIDNQKPFFVRILVKRERRLSRIRESIRRLMGHPSGLRSPAIVLKLPLTLALGIEILAEETVSVLLGSQFPHILIRIEIVPRDIEQIRNTGFVLSPLVAI